MSKAINKGGRKEGTIKASKKMESILILPDIRSAHNVGSIFRTADAAGVSRIVLCGYTPCPLDKFGRIQKDIAKTALGAEKSMRWKYEKTIKKALSDLKELGYKIVALEQSENSVDYKKFKATRKITVVLGNEVTGLPKNVLNLCDEAIEIPMMGEKESLNVSVATGIVLFRILGI